MIKKVLRKWLGVQELSNSNALLKRNNRKLNQRLNKHNAIIKKLVISISTPLDEPIIEKGYDAGLRRTT